MKNQKNLRLRTLFNESFIPTLSKKRFEFSFKDCIGRKPYIRAFSEDAEAYVCICLLKSETLPLL